MQMPPRNKTASSSSCATSGTLFASSPLLDTPWGRDLGGRHVCCQQDPSAVARPIHGPTKQWPQPSLPLHLLLPSFPLPFPLLSTPLPPPSHSPSPSFLLPSPFPQPPAPGHSPSTSARDREEVASPCVHGGGGPGRGRRSSQAARETHLWGRSPGVRAAIRLFWAGSCCCGSSESSGDMGTLRRPRGRLVSGRAGASGLVSGGASGRAFDHS